MKPSRTVRIIPLAVLTALALVTFAFWNTTKHAQQQALVAEMPIAFAKKDVRDVMPTDHVFGNPMAPLILVTYGDFECPFCKDYHKTLKRIVKMYGKDGKVAMVMRHMPIAKLHPHSPTYALASECVAEQGGSVAFWKFADALFDKITPDTNVDSAGLIDLARDAGVSEDDFSLCMRNSNLMSRVEESFDEALQAGATETPFTMIITPYQQIAQQGAVPFPVMGAMIKAMLRNIGDVGYTTASDETMSNLFDSSDDEAEIQGVSAEETPTIP